MSVNHYLTSLSSKLVLSPIEKENIKISLVTLSNRLNSYFGKDKLHTHFQFGSNTRGTILPRKADSNSDVDYMVVFKNPNNYKPNTLMKYLKDFMHFHYKTSDIHRDSPTMVLVLNHIKFELVPATQDIWGNYFIPSKKNLFTDEWMQTDPLGFNEKLTRVNVYNNSHIKPLTRLMKYWNTNKLDSYYSSYLMEDFLVKRFDYNNKHLLKYFLYDSIEGIVPKYNDSQTQKDRLDRAKHIIKEVRLLEEKGYNTLAKHKMEKLLPDI
ncbi:SMODS domain-containing nucleotidyltransferase [Halobacillus sp. K22]|uniref:SMODS domain-containing nucleotidyltransferase n=1 Tax=Halobacillus sp. K22 TaxID=3457431 RepID=UPI003FCE306E